MTQQQSRTQGAEGYSKFPQVKCSDVGDRRTWVCIILFLDDLEQASKPVFSKMGIKNSNSHPTPKIAVG